MNTEKNHQREIDDSFITQLEGWISGFHGEVAPLSSQSLAIRVNDYIDQEDCFEEKLGFVFKIINQTPSSGLDIGSSAGGLSVALAKKGVRMHGIEPSVSGIEVSKLRAARKKIDNVDFIQGVGEHLPFEDESFDFVISLAVLEHVQNVDEVISETYRVLKPGGKVYFEVPNNIFPFEAHYKMIWFPMMPKFIAKRYVKFRGAYPDFLDQLHYMSKFSVMRRFQKAGFSNVKDVYVNYIVGKCEGASWASKKGRLAKLSYLSPIFKFLFGYFPTSWLLNRAVYLTAEKSR